MAIMSKKKQPPEGDEPKPRYPSREKTKYVAITLDDWKYLESLGRIRDRSASYLARIAIREYRERNPLPPES